MSETLEKIEAILKRTEELHRALLEAADEKRNAIIKGDLPMMEELLLAEQACIAEIKKLEIERIALTETARTKLGITTEPVKMADIIAVVDEPFATRLADIRQRLADVLDKLRYRTRQNAELLHASVEHVNAFMHTVAEAGSKSNLYGPNGRREKGAMRLLDKSA